MFCPTSERKWKFSQFLWKWMKVFWRNWKFMHINYIYIWWWKVLSNFYVSKKKKGGKSINFLNQQKKLEEENSISSAWLKHKNFHPPFQDPGAPILTGWALIGLGFSSGTLRGRGCGVCTGVTLCTFFSGWGATGVHVQGCFFFL